MAMRDVAFELMEFLRSNPHLDEYRPGLSEMFGYAARYIRSMEDDKRHDAKLIRDLRRRGYCDERLRTIRGEEDAAGRHFSRQGGPCAGCGCKSGASAAGEPE